MDSRSDSWGHSLATGTPVRAGSPVGGASNSRRSSTADRCRFQVKHALRAVEDALALLEPRPAEGIEVAALERVRDDLVVVLRAAEAECR
jgi:hypothetical protein